MDYFGISVKEALKAHILDVHLPNVLVGITASIEIPLVTILGRRVGAPQPEIAKFVLISAICRTALDIPFGIIAEYCGVRNVMMGCLVINAVAALVGTTIVQVPSLVLYCVLSGISLGGFFLARHIFVAGISSKKYRGMLMSFLSGLLRWAHVIGPLLTGFVSSHTGDIRNAFYVAAAGAVVSLISISAAACSKTVHAQCERSCTPSSHRSLANTPEHTDEDVAEGLSQAGTSTSSTHPVVVGEESRPLVPPIPSSTLVPMQRDALLTGEGPVHPSMAAGEEHYFRVSALWCTILDSWTVIWRLGIYIVLFGALRANRKLMIMFAGMRASMDDAQVAYLLSFSFIFDAVLFPLGGIVMDRMGRRFAMVPVMVGVAIAFFLLPFCTSEVMLYVASSSFGVADALGCGLVMTLTADRAPKVYASPFFGVMRTIADLGHVVGAGGVSILLGRLGFDGTSWTLAATAIFTALWGLFGVPPDMEPLETPRLEQSARRHDPHLRHASGSGSAAESELPLLVNEANRREAPSASYGATK